MDASVSEIFELMVEALRWSEFRCNKTYCVVW